MSFFRRRQQPSRFAVGDLVGVQLSDVSEPRQGYVFSTPGGLVEIHYGHGQFGLVPEDIVSPRSCAGCGSRTVADHRERCGGSN